MLICHSCGLVFREDEVHTYTEDQGECHGAKALETWRVCPSCMEPDFTEAECCIGCGEWVSANKIEEELCMDCRDDADCGADVKIHPLFAEIVSAHFGMYIT